MFTSAIPVEADQAAAGGSAVLHRLSTERPVEQHRLRCELAGPGPGPVAAPGLGPGSGVARDLVVQQTADRLLGRLGEVEQRLGAGERQLRHLTAVMAATLLLSLISLLTLFFTGPGLASNTGKEL